MNTVNKGFYQEEPIIAPHKRIREGPGNFII